jgi:hypothetical protein
LFDAASTAIAFGEPVAQRFVPSSGSTAMSTSGSPSRPGADLLADVQHRRLVALALADDHRAAHRQAIHRLAHRLDGDAVRVLPVALPHRPRTGDGGVLDHGEKLSQQLLQIHGIPLPKARWLADGLGDRNAGTQMDTDGHRWTQMLPARPYPRCHRWPSVSICGFTAAMATLPLAGIRILDVGTRIAAPFAATLLGDFGAEVIKVELPGTGDFMRGIGPFDESGASLWWAVEGRNKKSITLDLRKPRGQELFRALARKADVVVENFQPGTLEEWGIGPDVLAREHPDLIVTRASVYGQTGPYRDRPGLDRNGIGFGGLLYLTGYPDRPPVRPGVIISDYLTGVFNALAIMIALYHRDVHRGGGQTVDLALYESVFRILEHTLPATTASASCAGARATG